MAPSIKEMMQYKNAAVFKRYEKEFPNNKLSAEEAFYNIIQYFWLSKKHEADKKNNPSDESLQFSCAVHPEMQEIDDMWHTFLLFTQDYADFCHRYFGEFIHHFPETEDKVNPTLFEIEFERYLLYIYENLGEKTVGAWFSDLMD